MTALHINDQRRLLSLFPRSDSLDYSTLTCKCGKSFTWNGFDDGLNPWLIEHGAHMTEGNNEVQK